MSIKEFNKKYRVELHSTQVGWGVESVFYLFDREKGERVAYEGSVYGEFKRFRSVEDALNWADTQNA